MQERANPGGFNKVMGTMNIPVAREAQEASFPGETRTPSCKKPRLADRVAESLSLSPLAVVGPQTAPMACYECRVM
jgi:hypothetical protein